MAFERSNRNGACINPVDEPVFCVNSAGVVTAEMVFKHFRFAKSRFRMKFNVLNQCQYLSLNFFIATVLSPLKMLKCFRRVDYFQNSSKSTL